MTDAELYCKPTTQTATRTYQVSNEQPRPAWPKVSSMKGACQAPKSMDTPVAVQSQQYKTGGSSVGNIPAHHQGVLSSSTGVRVMADLQEISGL
jgi:hypothetical protein